MPRCYLLPLLSCSVRPARVRINSCRRQTSNWQNSYSHRTTYLLSRLVICDNCGHQSDESPNPEAQALGLTIKDVEARIRRWEDTLECGLLPLEDAAHRIKELHAERAALLKKKIAMEKPSRVGSTVRAIPTNLMNNYVRAMQEKLREKKLGAKKEFLREIVKEVRVRDKSIQLIYKLPMVPRTSPPKEKPS